MKILLTTILCLLLCLPALADQQTTVLQEQATLGKVIHPTRLALTGRTVSPGMFDVMVLLGKEKTLERMHKAIEYIKAL